MIFLRLYRFLNFPLKLFVYGFALIIKPLKTAIAVRKTDRKHWPINEKRSFVLFHCSSLGEYEMALPLIEATKARGEYILVSFFSPSGYDQVKPNEYIDEVVYLPLDFKLPVKHFLRTFSLKLVVVMKYEIWPLFISELKKKEIPLVLANATISADHWTYRRTSGNAYQIFNHFDAIIFQHQEDYDVAQDKLTTACSLAGDVRFDRVAAISEQDKRLEIIDQFVEEHSDPIIIMGSSWPTEEELMHQVLISQPHFKVIIAPHDISDNHIDSITHLFKEFNPNLYTQKSKEKSNVMIVNTIGVLSQLYRYGDVAIIGGAFGKGLHNILEALAWDVPVLFGPNTNAFPEAQKAKNEGVAKSFKTAKDLSSGIEALLNTNNQPKKWIEKQTGATKVHLQVIESFLNQ